MAGQEPIGFHCEQPRHLTGCEGPAAGTGTYGGGATTADRPTSTLPRCIAVMGEVASGVELRLEPRPERRTIPERERVHLDLKLGRKLPGDC